MKNKKLPSVIVLMILTLLTTVFWMLFSIYRTFTKPTSVEVSEEITSPISPNLDTETIEMIRSKVGTE